MQRKNSPALDHRGQGFFRKTALSLLFVFVLSQVTMYAEAYANPVHIPTRTYYISWRDEYRTDFSGPGAYEFAWFMVEFEAESGMVYQTEYDYYTGIMYLTCNGVYTLKFLDSEQNVIWQSDPIVTNSIKDPACLSYPEQSGQDDLNADYTENDDGSYTLHWDDLPGAESYEIWENGELVGIVTSPGDSFNLPGNGSISIVAKDENGDYIGHSDLQVPTFDGSDDWGNENGKGWCDLDVCNIIRDALACPEWDQYMGEWRDMLESVIPPPPDWDVVSNTFADTFVNAFNEWLGDMPTPPAIDDLYDQINEPFPIVDTSFPEAENLIPVMPEEYEQPFEFDITAGDQIQIVDESEPIEINDPLHDYDHDEPGVMVFPGDPRNHSDGLKEPGRILDSEPIPAAPPAGDLPSHPIPIFPDEPDVPPAIMPIPTAPPSNIPIPERS